MATATSKSIRQQRGSVAKPTVRARRPSRVGAFFRGVGAFLGLITMLLLLAGIAAAGYAAYMVQETQRFLPQNEKMLAYQPGGITTIYATDKDPKTGQLVILARIYSQYKEFEPITEMPEVLKEATIAIEDERFNQHRGIDFEAIARAVLRNIESRDLSEGASTITQQLARTVFLTQKKTFSRKLQEILLAILLEKNFSKEQILEMYLNEVCYGVNTYGAKAAAKVYFGRELKNLSLSQAALLAGLPQQPTRLEPFKHKDAAIKRRNLVLGKMAELGYITPEKCKVAQSNGVFLISKKPSIRSVIKAPYFTTYVIQQLKKEYGQERLDTGGFQVYTTLNYAMQKEAERALINGVIKARGTGVTQGAMVSVEPRTGYIRAMVGGVDFNKYQYNNAAQGGRQPGSSFKPFVYVTAMAMQPGRYGPNSYVDNSRRSYGKYSPGGSGPSGSVALKTAVAWSYNNASVNTANAIGVRNVISTARKLGITSPMDPNLSLALGAYEVTPLEMASAYSAFANHGSHAAPMGIIRVVDQEGVMLANNQPRVNAAAIPESAVAGIGEALRAVVEKGTASKAEGIHDVADAHGKTGTTNDNKDSWFVGYTPELSTAVWVCGLHYEKRGKVTVPVYRRMAGAGGETTGGRVCAPMWARFMKAAIPIQRAAKLPRLVPAEKTMKAGEPSPTPSPEPRRRRRRRRSTNGDVTRPPTQTEPRANNATPAPEAPTVETPREEPRPVEVPREEPKPVENTAEPADRPEQPSAEPVVVPPA
ncbi:MAG: PBP1A family penicillin-binding protein [Akkermansiaceae bacterium]|nr:PBP1A family penicillin-binding protein [Armatimonadota bacterium]